MTALSFVWVHPYSQISGCDTYINTYRHKSKVFKLKCGSVENLFKLKPHLKYVSIIKHVAYRASFSGATSLASLTSIIWLNNTIFSCLNNLLSC